MRKITILEVLDPVKNEFIPIRQAINQGLFNTKTYLFFDPVENKHYSITEAAQQGMFKSAIDLRPEALIVERVKIAQTVQLLSARDPQNLNRLIDIKEAIEKSIVDPNLRIYRNDVTNQVIDLSDAIERGLVQVKIVRETTEKITETVTEKKTPDSSLGLIKKTETSSSSKSSLDSLTDYEDNSNDEGVKFHNGNYLFDRTKSLNVNKRMKKYDDDVTAGFISDKDSRKLLDPESNFKLKSILKSDPKSTMSPLIDFNEAVIKNLIILPDSLLLTNSVQYVIDLSTGNRIEFDEACNRGIIDVRNKKYIDKRDNSSLTLFEALNNNYIIMKDELDNNYQDNKYDRKLNAIKNFTANDILSFFNPITGTQISVSKAIELGIYDIKQNSYFDLLNKKYISLRVAVEKGLIVLKPDQIENEDYEQLNIKAIKNPINGKEMPLNEAISAGFLDYAECEFHDPVSGRTYTLLDAYDKGYLITTSKPIPNSISNHSTNTFTEEPAATISNSRKSRKDRDSDYYDQVVEEKKQSSSTTTITNTKTVITSSVEPVAPAPVAQKPANRSQSFNTISNLNKSSNSNQFHENNNNRNKPLRATSSFDIKSFDRLSLSSRKSVIRRIKEKMFGKKSKSNILNENVIISAMRIIDTKNKNKLSLIDAIKSEIAIPEDKLVDTENERELSIPEAIENGVIKFFHPINNFEFKYDQSCYIFGTNLLLVNYVLNPADMHHKIGLRAAFNRNVLDRDNGVYFSRKGPVSLVIAIEKGYLSCEIIDLNLLNAIFTSNIFKYSTYKPNQLSPPSHQPPHPVETVSNINLNEIKVVKTEQQTKNIVEEIKSKLDSNNVKKINQNEFISKDVLKSSGMEFDDEKNYVIKDIYDAENNKYISVANAKRIGIYNLDTQEYIDSKTGEAFSIIQAIRRNKIRIEEFNLNKQQRRVHNSKSETSITSSSQLQGPITSEDDEDELDSISIKQNQKSIRADTITSEHISIKSNMDYLDESDEELKEKKRLKEIELQIRRDMSPISKPKDGVSIDKLDSLSDVTFTQTINTQNDKIHIGNETEFADSFNLCKSLLYKTPNGKLIKFEKIIQNGLFDRLNAKFKDSTSDEYLTLNEALLNGLLKLNDSFVLFDDKRIYVIETVLYNNRKISLIDAVNKNLIDKRNCTYFSANLTENEPISIKDAMKNGYIEGKIITSSEVKWMLNDYAKKTETKLSSSSSKTLNQSTISTSSKKSIESNNKFVKKGVSLHEIKVLDDENNSLSKNKSSDYLSRLQNLNNSLETFTEYFVYDAETEMYISLNDAFYNGNVLNEPVRVRDPTNGSYILLKDAIIKGLISTQKSNERVDFKNRSTFVTFDRVSYIVDHVYEPRKRNKLSCQEAAKKGLFINGIYKHPYKQETMHIDSAISNGYVVGKKVDLSKMDDIFKSWLTLPPTKPSRGVFLNDQPSNRKIKSASTNDFQTENNNEELEFANEEEKAELKDHNTSKNTSRKVVRKKKYTSEETILRSNIQPISGKISQAKDVMNDRYVKLNEAEKLGIINFTKGLFKNSLTKEEIQINEAIEKGYILLDRPILNSSISFPNQETLDDSNQMKRLRSASKQSKQTFNDSSIDDLADNRIEVAQQFEIVSILDRSTGKTYDLDSSIRLGLFDVESAMYVDKSNANERLTLIEAIDQGLINISDKSFRTSYKLEIENRKTNKKTTLSIRFVVDPLTQDIVPVNVACSKNLVDLDDGYYVGHNRLTLKEAYEKCLILTKEDLDDAESRRARFNVVLARKSTNGKNMSVKSALAKNWLNIDRRVYIDKQTNEEIAFSQAVDMDLLVLRHIDLDRLQFNAKKIQREETVKSKLIR